MEETQMFKKFMALSILVAACGPNDIDENDPFGGSSPSITSQTALATYGDLVRILGFQLGFAGERRVEVSRWTYRGSTEAIFPTAREIVFDVAPDLAKPIPGSRRVGQCVVLFATSSVGFTPQRATVSPLETYVQNRFGQWVDKNGLLRDGSRARARIEKIPETVDVVLDVPIGVNPETHKVTLTTLSPMALRLDSETNEKSSRQEDLRLSWTTDGIDPDEHATLLLDNNFEYGGSSVVCPLNLNVGAVSVPKEILQVLNKESLTITVERKKVTSGFFNTSEILEWTTSTSASTSTKLTNLPREQIE
jgi:hypothetical protein